MVDKKTIVLKFRLDSTMVKQLGEKLKCRLFTKMRFLKPKPEEVRLVSIDKYYEPYIIVGGKYAIDYCKKSVYSIKVDENAQEVVFFDTKIKPDAQSNLSTSAHKSIKLNGVAHFHYEDKAQLILDMRGREVEFKQLPFAPSEELTVEELTKTGIKLVEDEISPEK
jgi:hypothetical protein